MNQPNTGLYKFTPINWTLKVTRTEFETHLFNQSIQIISILYRIDLIWFIIKTTLSLFSHFWATFIVSMCRNLPIKFKYKFYSWCVWIRHLSLKFDGMRAQISVEDCISKQKSAINYFKCFQWERSSKIFRNFGYFFDSYSNFVRFSIHEYFLDFTIQHI